MKKKTIQVIFDNVANAYDETRTIPSFVIRKAFSILHEKVNLSEKKVILDAGIGTGRICRSLSQYDIKLIGIDFSPKMLRKCMEENRDETSFGKVTLIQGDITHLPLKSSTFDVILAIHVLNFAGQKAIEEFRRVLKLGGFLIFARYTNPPRETSIAKKYAEQHRKHSASAKACLTSIFSSLLPAFLFKKVVKAIYLWRHSYVEKSATSVQTERIKWKQSVQTSEILKILEKKIYSEYFNTPDETHRKIMKNLKEWIEKTTLGELEEVECMLEMKIIQY